MTGVTVLQNISGPGRKVLVRRERDGAHFVVSTVGAETLAFASDHNGRVANFSEVAGGRGWTRDQVIAALEVAQ